MTKPSEHFKKYLTYDVIVLAKSTKVFLNLRRTKEQNAHIKPGHKSQRIIMT